MLVKMRTVNDDSILMLTVCQFMHSTSICMTLIYPQGKKIYEVGTIFPALCC